MMPTWKAKRCPRRRSDAGFATVEVLVTVAIVVIVSTISITALGRSDRARLQTEVADIALVLQQARLLAAERGRPVAISYTSRTQTLTTPYQSHTLGSRVSSPNDDAELTIRPSGENDGLVLVLVSGDLSREVELDWLTGQIRLVQ